MEVILLPFKISPFCLNRTVEFRTHLPKIRKEQWSLIFDDHPEHEEHTVMFLTHTLIFDKARASN